MHRCCLVECLLLEFETGMQIHLDRVHRLMTEPHRDHRRVDTAVKQSHRGAMAQHVGRNPLACQGGTLLPGSPQVFSEQIRDAITTQPSTSGAAMTSNVKGREQLFLGLHDVFYPLRIRRGGASKRRRLILLLSVGWVPPSLHPSGACLNRGTSVPVGALNAAEGYTTP